jgi:sulfate transport system ATP-binding protein
VVMNEGRIEQIGTPAEIYDHPATPFVMGFVGAVNVLPAGALSVAGARQEAAAPSAPALFVRPHDVQVFAQPQPGTVPARLRRLTHLGRELQADLELDSGDAIQAQFPRDQFDLQGARPGDVLHVLSRQARSFEPDYTI